MLESLRDAATFQLFFKSFDSIIDDIRFVTGNTHHDRYLFILVRIRFQFRFRLRHVRIAIEQLARLLIQRIESFIPPRFWRELGTGGDSRLPPLDDVVPHVERFAPISV